LARCDAIDATDGSRTVDGRKRLTARRRCVGTARFVCERPTATRFAIDSVKRNRRLAEAKIDSTTLAATRSSATLKGSSLPDAPPRRAAHHARRRRASTRATPA